MPLSEYEQRVLEQLERDLGADPKLKTAMARNSNAGPRVVLALLGVVVGLGIVLAGVMMQQPLVGVAGFVLMMGVALWAIVAPSRKSKQPKAAGGTASVPQAKQQRAGFMTRLEQRFERRRERGEF